MSDEIIKGQLQPPKPTGAAAVLAAFRELTDWTDEDVLHYATCSECDPRDGDYTWYCDNSPLRKRQREQEAARPPRGEPVRPQSPLAAALQRAAEQVIADTVAKIPLSDGAIRSTATPERLAALRDLADRNGGRDRTPRPFWPPSTF
jgi:hypothetical protein